MDIFSIFTYGFNFVVDSMRYGYLTIEHIMTKEKSTIQCLRTNTVSTVIPQQYKQKHGSYSCTRCATVCCGVYTKIDVNSSFGDMRAKINRPQALFGVIVSWLCRLRKNLEKKKFCNTVSVFVLNHVY